MELSAYSEFPLSLGPVHRHHAGGEARVSRTASSPYVLAIRPIRSIVLSRSSSSKCFAPPKAMVTRRSPSDRAWARRACASRGWRWRPRRRARAPPCATPSSSRWSTNARDSWMKFWGMTVKAIVDCGLPPSSAASARYSSASTWSAGSGKLARSGECLVGFGGVAEGGEVDAVGHRADGSGGERRRKDRRRCAVDGDATRFPVAGAAARAARGCFASPEPAGRASRETRGARGTRTMRDLARRAGRDSRRAARRRDGCDREPKVARQAPRARRIRRRADEVARIALQFSKFSFFSWRPRADTRRAFSSRLHFSSRFEPRPRPHPRDHGRHPRRGEASRDHRHRFPRCRKTTLVNHILKGDHGKLIAVIENEFGAVSIDDALVGGT